MKKLLTLKGVKKLNKKELKAIQGGLACHPDWAPCPGTHLICVNYFCELK
ncbi:MAG TPA: hypothetical protein DCS93_12975 [Microscillaceae bacterium]|nr:hypothetical protein [Microscillaceae bacterium]